MSWISDRGDRTYPTFREWLEKRREIGAILERQILE